MGAPTVGPSPDEDYIVSEVICCLLGGNSSSRLYQIIREQRGLAYTVSMDIESFTDTSILNGYVGLDGNNLDSVKQVVRDELNRLKTELVDENELERTKEYIKGTTLIGFERTSARSSFIINSTILGLDANFENYLNDISSVTAEQIREFANKYFTDDNICFAQIKPKS
jgi:predicted Zn-dependent peptidase